MAMVASTEIEHSYQAYQERQYSEVSRSGLVARAARMEPGGLLGHVDGAWRAEAYPGHAVVSMVGADPANRALESRLIDAQAMLAESFPEPGLLYLLPRTSFHQTVANTLSADRHQRHVVDSGRAASYPREVTAVLGEISQRSAGVPVQMRMIGLSLFGSALGVLGVFEQQDHFERIIGFRDAFYGNPAISAWGISRTRPFIGHVTLGYLGRTIDAAERQRFVDAAERVTAGLFLDGPVFHLPFAELRAYHHLAEFNPLPDLPSARL